MNIFITYVIFFLGFSAFSQTDTKIVKKIYIRDREIIVQNMYFKNSNLIWKINFANNGWQILDSISYEYKNPNYCTKIYKPEYNELSNKIKSFKLTSLDCSNNYNYNSLILRTTDVFFLSKYYTNDLDFLLKLNPILKSNLNNQNEYHFKKKVIPSILTNFGIPINEKLEMFTFTFNNKLIESDFFKFEHFVLKRKYEYKDSILSIVYIEVINNKNKKTHQFKEMFMITPVQQSVLIKD